jgi:hypothetical protein
MASMLVQLLLCAFLLVIISVQAEQSLSCKDWSGSWIEVPAARVNDGYCDCLGDGADETNSNGCALNINSAKFELDSARSSKFLCVNEGYESASIPSSAVDDKICDCCDGTDEIRIKCPKVCLEELEDKLDRSLLAYQEYDKGIELQAKVLKAVIQRNLPKTIADYKHWSKVVEQTTQQYYQYSSQYKSLSAADQQGQRGHQLHQSIKQLQSYYSSIKSRQMQLVYLLQIEETENAPQANGAPLPPKIPDNSENLWISLYDQCYSYLWVQQRYGAFGAEYDKYNIVFCPLHNTTSTKALEETAQPTGSVTPTVLGIWMNEINSTQSSSAGSHSVANAPRFRLHHVYGDKCYNGPHRSVGVKILCGQDSSVKSFSENGLCQYELVFQSPVACSTQYHAQWKDQLQRFRRLIEEAEENEHSEL